MDKNYIKRKIKNCEGLVDNAISDAQKAVYEGYLEFWQEKLGGPKESEEELKEPFDLGKFNDIAFKLAMPSKEVAEITLDDIEDIPKEPEEVTVEFDDKSINEYEEDTGKKAIWKGVITNGFKEFLKSKL